MALEANKPGSSPGNEITDQVVTDDAIQTDVNQSADAAAPVDQGKPSTPEDERSALLSIVKKAVEKPEADAGSSSAPEEKTEGPSETKAAEGDEKKPEEAGDEDKPPPFSNHPRWKQVLRQRDEYRVRAEALEREAVPLAQQMQSVRAFMTQHELSDEEVAEGFQIMAAMKNRPDLALQMLAPKIEALREVAGDILPDDIRQRVENGALDEASARELSRARATQEILKAEREAQAQRQQEIKFRQQETQREEALKDAVVSSLTVWENSVRKTDPAFDQKVELMQTRVAALIAQRGRPDSPETGVKMAQEAYAWATSQLRSVASAGKRPVTPVPSRGSASGAAAPSGGRQMDPLDVARLAAQTAGH